MSDKKRFQDHTQTIQFRAIKDPKKGADVRKAFLTVIRGGGNDLGKHIVVEKPIVMGRAPDCDLTIQDLGTSWHHARITPKSEGIYEIEDLNSTNGTRINGVLIEGPWKLREGEKIFLGEAVVRFGLADEMDLGFQSEVSQLVGTDPLTGLESKRGFDNALDYALEIARRLEQPLAVLMMDMDGVKAINDQHGHLFGAHAIGETGRIIARVVGKDGHACRFGGDEFTVFLTGHDKPAGVRVAEKIRTEVEEAEVEKDGIKLSISISIGVASFPEDGDHVLELVAAADAALYRAKGAGKNRVST
jgi:two-component system cell cycle response regulator